jgi:phospholipase C
VRRTALGFAVAAVVAGAAWTSGAVARAAEPKTPIRHVVTLLQENHTYDNYFGTYPRGEGTPPGVCMPVDPAATGGPCIRPFHIGDNKVVPRDLDHSAETYRLQWNRGRLNGFVHALDVRNQDGRLAMGYYDGRDLPYYWNLADEYVLYDHFFSSAGAGSFLNHVYWVTGAPGGGRDRLALKGVEDLPTIFDRLEAKGISWKFYVQNYDPRLNFRTITDYPGNRASQVIWVPLLNIPRFIDDHRLFSHIVDLSQYYRDLDQGTLPAVAFIAPSGPSEHPPSSVRSGQAFVRTLINGLVRSTAWKDSAFVLAYDDWGGWFDHVKPPQVDDHGYGFRVPALLVSPYARRGYIDSTVLDFTSILKFVEQNWGLAPLAERDRKANSIASGFDFSSPPRRARFTAAVRGGEDPEAGVRRPLIYIFYGSGLVLPALLIGWAAIGRRRRPMGVIPATDEGRAA